MTIEELEKKAVRARFDALKAIYKTSFGYIGNAMSSVEILVSMFYGDVGTRAVMNFDVNKPGWDGRDYFVLSKVSATPVYYAILANLGFFDHEELEYFAQRGSILKMYPDLKVPGVSATVVSEGQGLGIAMGIAMAVKAERKKNRVYVLLDRHELMIGDIWESVFLSAMNRLDNLVVVVDSVQFDDTFQMPDIYQKFSAFGWNVINVLNGHDFDEILDAYVRSFRVNRRPTMILCRTVSGKGIEFAERKAGYFKANLSEGEMMNVLPKLEELL